MKTPAVQADAPPDQGNQASRSTHLREIVEHAAHLLPAQGPITVFIHHNTLHAFEDQEFHDAVKAGAQVFGCQPYLSEDRFRSELRRGRIRFSELQEVLEQDLGELAQEKVPCFGSRLELRLAMLQYPLRTGPTDELVWYVAEADALRRIREEVSSAVRARLIAETRRWVMRDLRGGSGPTLPGSLELPTVKAVPDSIAELLDRFGESKIEEWSDQAWEGFTLQALWRVCCDGVRDLPSYTEPPPPPVRYRDILLETTGADADAPVNDLLIRFCASFLDQGLAYWQLPDRDQGFYRAFCNLYRQPWGSPARWLRGLPQELARLEDQRIGPLDSILESLEILGVAEEEWGAFISSTLLALRGWGGMVHHVEHRGDRTVHPVPEGSLVEFLAVRLLLDRFSLAYTARDALGFDGPLSAMQDAARVRFVAHWAASVEQRAFQVFQLAQLAGVSPNLLHRLKKHEWATLLAEVESFSGVERRRVFQLAYERRFYVQTLDAIALHARNPVKAPPKPRFQAVFCIDEREESLRRHLEELAPDAETFGTAGFFSIAMYFRAAADAHYVPLCPAVIRPQHWVIETVVESDEAHRRRTRTRRVLGRASHQLHTGSRSFATGAVLSTAVGVLASIPLVAGTFVPRLFARIRQRFGRLVDFTPLTRLHLERTEPTPGPEGGQIGFTLEEMTNIAEKVLRETGLAAAFSRVVLIIGHGSTSMNNPHESAHDCGACGGARGGPNARALAQILNDPRVREGLEGRGVPIPADTIFVGGMHNTSSENINFYDVDLVPDSHLREFQTVHSIVHQASDRDAHERSRRFYSAPLTLSFPDARQHVETRAEDLAQVRPEWGHATNAISIVGRREATRGLFLDRRAFLTSYDPTQDPGNKILLQILSAVFPVCAGINLEYYFSYVDNTGFGSGTKLPHNISSLLGVMDGAASDLRTGLPWQMVEIHEPVRLLFIIETTAEAMWQIMDQNAGIGRLCRNGWIKLALLHPETHEVGFFENGEFQPYEPQASVLPKAASSVDWYRGWREHLEFAEIK